ncbi:MAG: hypothetical protein WCF26_05020 [Candidatus Sulfotelmatobacter sp.]
MEPRNYKKALSDAKAELLSLIQKRDETETRIAQLRQTIRALAEICEESPKEIELWMTRNASGRPSGLTDAIRWVVRTSDKPLSPTEIRDELARRGFDLHGYQNPLASIHTVITRLGLKLEIDYVPKVGYRWHAGKN